LLIRHSKYSRKYTPTDTTFSAILLFGNRSPWSSANENEDTD